MNLVLTFTYTISLKDWEKAGLLEREILIYQRFSQKGINLWFLTYGDKSDFSYSDKLKGIKIVPIKNKIKYFPFLKTLLFPIFNYKLFKNVDIIKTNQMEGSWITWILKIIFRKKVIIRCGYEALKNTLFEYKLFKKRRLLLKLLFLYFVELVSYKISDHIILSNLYDKKFVIRLFKIKPKKISLISNFIDTEKFRPIPTEKKENTILYIGRLKEEKNLENLIKSFKYLKDYSLDIIGKGELKPLLLKKIDTLNLQSQIKFLGMIPNSEIPEVINQYHILILPSLWEGNPKVILEAMSCGVMCIGTNIPGIKEIITHKKNGFLCKKDSKSIAYAIKYIFDNPKLRESLGKNAREYIIKNNSLEKIYKNEIKIFESLL